MLFAEYAISGVEVGQRFNVLVRSLRSVLEVFVDGSEWFLYGGRMLCQSVVAAHCLLIESP